MSSTARSRRSLPRREGALGSFFLNRKSFRRRSRVRSDAIPSRASRTKSRTWKNAGTRHLGGRPRPARFAGYEGKCRQPPLKSVLIICYDHYLAGQSKAELRFGAVIISQKGAPKWVQLSSANYIRRKVRRAQEAIQESADEQTLMVAADVPSNSSGSLWKKLCLLKPKPSSSAPMMS